MGKRLGRFPSPVRTFQIRGGCVPFLGLMGRRRRSAPERQHPTLSILPPRPFLPCLPPCSSHGDTGGRARGCFPSRSLLHLFSCSPERCGMWGGGAWPPLLTPCPAKIGPDLPSLPHPLPSLPLLVEWGRAIEKLHKVALSTSLFSARLCIRLRRERNLFKNFFFSLLKLARGALRTRKLEYLFYSGST